MKTVHLTQGTPEWIAHRREHFNASDAPAMMGCSPYKTRSQLLRELLSGLSAEVDAGTQRRFDDGHRFEALARPLAEQIIGEELYPIVGTEGKLSASFDGLTLMNDAAFEHKTLNDELRACIVDEACGALLPMHYRVQMEQQLLISGADKCLFMATKWNGDELAEQRWTWYYADEVLRAQILAGWKQFAADLADYNAPPEVAAEVVAAPVESLPVVSVRMEGSIAVISNLTLFGDKLRAFVERIDRNPSTDQAFADAEAAIKTLQTAQDALEQAEAAALAQTSSIEEMRRTVADYANLARTTRLALKKIVDARKEQIKVEIVTEGRDALAAHIAALNQRLGKPYMPAVPADFAGAIKGKKTVASLRDAMGTELARAKIEASAIADRIQINLGTLRELAADHAFLFADTASIVLKAPDDLTMLVKGRISEHQAAEAKRLEAERERIRAEEAARLEREAKAAEQASIAAELQAEQERLRVEAQRQREAAQNTQAQTPQQVLKAEPETADATDRGVSVIASPDGGPMGAGQAAAAAPAGEIRQIHPAAAALRNEQPTLTLGAMKDRLGFALTADFLAQLGFGAMQVKSARLYRESEWPDICAGISAHVLACAKVREAA